MGPYPLWARPLCLLCEPFRCAVEVYNRENEPPCRCAPLRKGWASNEEIMSKPTKEPNGEVYKLPMMPIREMVIFPHMMTPFVVGRESSVRALEEALTGDRKIFLATQHDASIDEPSSDDIYAVGVIGNIVQSVRMPDGNVKVLVEGVERARTLELNDEDGFFVATVRTGTNSLTMTPAVEQLMQRVQTLFEQHLKLQQSLNYETVVASSKDRRRDQAGGHDCGQSAAVDRGETGPAGRVRPGGAAVENRRHAGHRH